MGTKEIIKSGREKLGMSHLAFGNAVGVSRGAVQQWEKGTTEPTRKHQPKIAALLGITVAELMQYTGSLARVAAGLDGMTTAVPTLAQALEVLASAFAHTNRPQRRFFYAWRLPFVGVFPCLRFFLCLI